MPDEYNIPTEMKCPISKLIMADPVIPHYEGHHYDKDWIELCKKSPLTQAPLVLPVTKNITSDINLRARIWEYIAQNPELIIKDEVSMPLGSWEKLRTIISQGAMSEFIDFCNKDPRYLLYTPQEAQQRGLLPPVVELPTGSPLEWILASNNIVMLNFMNKARGEPEITELQTAYPNAVANKQFLDLVSANLYTSAILLLNAGRANINAIDVSGRNALPLAIIAIGNLRFQLENSPEEFNAHYQEYLNFVKFLLANHDFVPRLNNVAWYAAAFGQLETLKLLEQQFGEEIITEDCDPQYFLHAAVLCPNKKLLHYLLKKPRFADTINNRYYAGQTPLFMLVDEDYPDDHNRFFLNADKRKEIIACVNLLIKHGADVRLENNNQCPPLMYIKYPEIGRVLLKAGQYTPDELTNIFEKNSFKDAATLKLFIEFGMKEIKGIWLSEALHCQKVELAKAYILSGAPVNEHEYYWSCLSTAITKTRDPNITLLLIEHGAEFKGDEEKYLDDEDHLEYLRIKAMAAAEKNTQQAEIEILLESPKQSAPRKKLEQDDLMFFRAEPKKKPMQRFREANFCNLF